MSSIRQEKVSELIKRELSLIFLQDSRSLCMGSMVSVTVVRISKDLSYAKVYISIFGGNDTKATFLNIKNKAAYIKKQLADRVKKSLRKSPELSFYLDDTLDYAEEINEILKS